MAAPITVKDWSHGVIKDQPAFELAPGYWSDALNVRFFGGNSVRMGGIASVITPSITPYWMLGYSSGATPYVAYAGTTKAYVHDGSSETEITRLSTPAIQTVSSATITSNVATFVLGANHLLAIGDVVSTAGFVSAAFNVTNAVITAIPTAARFSVAVSAPNDTATTQGTYTVSYWAAGVTTNFTGTQDDKWTGGNVNGVLLANNPVNGVFYWDQTYTNKLHLISGFAGIADFARPFKNYIVLGAPTISGTKYRHQVMWSNAAEPGTVPMTFTASDTNDAGEVDEVSDGGLVDGLTWGEYFILYKRDARFRMTYIGGNNVFAFQKIQGHGDDGLLAANCVVNTPAGQVYLTDGKDLRIHAGAESKSIVYGRMYEYLRANIDPTYQKRSFLSVNSIFSEVWVCYPKTGQTACTEAVVWNWQDDTLAIRSLSGVTFGCSGEFPTTIANSSRMLIANNTPKIGLVDSGYTDFGVTLTSTLERTGMDLDSPMWKTLGESFPRFQAASTGWTATIYHGSAPTPDGTVTYAVAQTYTHGTTRRVSSESNSGPYLAWKMTTTANETPALRTIDFYINQNGDY